MEQIDLDMLYYTPWSSVLLEKLSSSQLVNIFPAFYEAQSFITAFTRPRHLPYPEPDQSSPCPLILLPEHPS